MMTKIILYKSTYVYSLAIIDANDGKATLCLVKSLYNVSLGLGHLP